MVISSFSYRKLCIRLLLSFGYGLNIWVIHSLGLVCVVNHTDIPVSNLFVNMPARDDFWLLLFARVVDIDQTGQLLVKMLPGDTVCFEYQFFSTTHRLLGYVLTIVSSLLIKYMIVEKGILSLLLLINLVLPHIVLV